MLAYPFYPHNTNHQIQQKLFPQTILMLNSSDSPPPPTSYLKSLVDAERDAYVYEITVPTSVK